MKTRSGFVSNSSSSSFILFGNTFSPLELVNVVEANDPLLLSTIVGDIDEFKQVVDDELEEGRIESFNEAMHQVFGEYLIDTEDYVGENGEVRLGLCADPDYLKEDQVLNGLWTPEEVQGLRDLAARLNMKIRVSGGTWYS